MGERLSMDREVYARAATRYRGDQPLKAVSTGTCIHDGCNDPGYDLTENYCSCHFVTNVLTELEDILHQANLQWAATVLAEHEKKEIWRCQCGFQGTFAQRDAHFADSDFRDGHGPPVADSPIRSRIVGNSGRKRMTPVTNPNKLEEIG